jgi:predicted nucleotide-binding protein
LFPCRCINVAYRFPDLCDSIFGNRYAVVLFTGDDEGRKRGAPSLQFRARQNVVYEMGLFIGKLRRDKVCAVVEPDVELPSDLQGIVFKLSTSSKAISSILFTQSVCANSAATSWLSFNSMT